MNCGKSPGTVVTQCQHGENGCARPWKTLFAVKMPSSREFCGEQVLGGAALLPPGGFLAFKAISTQRLRKDSGRSPGRTPVAALPAVFPPPPLPSMERRASHTLFRTTGSRALLKSSGLCTVPAGCAQTPQGWRKLAVKGAFPPLRPIALRLRKAWVIRTRGGGDGEGSNACPTVRPLLFS